MRRFHDPQGTEWTVALSRGSYGSVTLVFAATGDTGRIYWSALEAATAAEGHGMLAGLSEAQLRERLAGAQPYTG